MNREEALEKIAWHELKHLTREEATEIIQRFFNEPLKPSLREKLNITAIIQWETHAPPPDLQPGREIYRPILIDRMSEPFRGATNDYLADYLRRWMELEVDEVVGDLPDWFACPACDYRTLPVRGDWAVCPVCGWVSDPVQEAMPGERVGGNPVSLDEARANFREIGAISEEKRAAVDPEGPRKYPK
ncbi:MAG: CPCC family cysteine-rich protein, partial [Anaerolineae bacterium]